MDGPTAVLDGRVKLQKQEILGLELAGVHLVMVVQFAIPRYNTKYWENPIFGGPSDSLSLAPEYSEKPKH